MAVINEAPGKYWDFEALKNPPAYKVDDDPESAVPGLQSIIYDGVEENGKKTGCFAYTAVPEGEMPDGGWPGIVLVHGGGGTAFAWAAELWKSYGYAVIVPDWYGRRPGEADKNSEPGEKPRRYVAGEREHAYENTLCHITNAANLVLAHSLLRSLPQVNSDKTAYVGLSWGSWYGAMVTAIDPRFRGVIEIYLGDRKDDGFFINGRFLHAAQNKMYYVLGTNDTHGSPASFQDAFDTLGEMLGGTSLIVELPHSHAGFRFQPCRRYADALLKDAPGLPKVEKMQVDGSKLSAAVSCCGKGIKKAFLCWTGDRDEEVPSKRKWQMLEAQYDKSAQMLTAVLPEKCYQCYFAAYDEEDISTHCCGTGNVVTLP